MPRNGSGGYSLPQPPFVPNTTISSAAVNSDLSDIATALSQSVSSDGQTPITGTLKFANGSAAAPSHTFNSDPTTGMFYPGTKQLGFSAGGVLGLNINENNVGTGQNGNVITQLTGAVIAPVGVVHDFAGSTAPPGWFLCYGQAISRNNYPELFFVISTTYGPGDGSTTFNLPDARGRVSAGVDNMGGTPANRVTNAGSGITGTTLGATGGSQNQIITQGNLPAVSFANSGIALNDPGHFHLVGYHGVNLNISGGGGGFGPEPQNYPGANNVSSQTVSTGITISSQGSAASGGSGLSFSIMQPTIMFNKIIFAGRV